MTDASHSSKYWGTFRQRLRNVPALSLLVAAIAVVIDQITKQWAVSHLSDGHVDHVIWTLQFNLSFNSGMAFGRAQGWGPVIAVAATVIIVGFVLTLRRTDSRMSIMAVGLIIGGALGNLIDRIFRNDAWLRGRVVDFIDFQWFPIFNIADICINVGGVLLVLSFLRSSAASA